MASKRRVFRGVVRVFGELAVLGLVGTGCSAPATVPPPDGDEGFAGTAGTSFGGSSGFGGTSSVDTRPVVTSARTPPPISGGTLIALPNGLAALSDPDRDRIVTVDVAADVPLVEIQLAAGDEPGRLVADSSGRVHVVLRGTGEIVSIDPLTGDVLTRRAVCAAPRGIAFDAANDALVVACLEGTLVELPVQAGEAFRTTAVAPDLRDVVLLGTTLVATRFRSAEILYLDEERNVTRRVTPLADHADFAATTAWRAVAAPDGELVVAHQRALDLGIDIVDPTTGGTGGVTGSGDVVGKGGTTGMGSGYGSPFDPCASIVQGTITTANETGVLVTHSTLPMIAVPVDIAVSATGVVAVANGAFDRDAVNRTSSSLLAFDRTTLPNTASDCGASIRFVDFQGTVTAVAFDEDGNLLAQTRQPSALWVYDMELNSRAIELGGEDVTDTGHAIFHADTGNGIACASCHAEGTDDGHVWNFTGLGPRRTQPLDVDLRGTAPFHWDGTLPSFGHLVHEVFQRRMGGPEETAERITALENYVYGLPRRPPSRIYDAAAERGKGLFESEDVGCAACHTGPKFSNGLTESIGKGNATQVPSLLAVSARAPFMHDGCAATLRDRFDPGCGGERHGNTTLLSEAELDDLIAYLESL